MFSLLRGRVKEADFSSIRTDMHSHLLPGIDDGAKTLEDSIEMIRGLKNLGYEKLITTPHVYQEFYPNTPDSIKRALEPVLRRIEKEGIEIELEAAAEYFLDEHFAQLLKEDRLLTFGDRYVLVEISFYFETPNLRQYIFELCSKGYQPILAHPERYLYYEKMIERYAELKEWGCLLQMNLLSLTGHYGKPVQQLAQRLLKEDLIDLVGTDMHRIAHLETLQTAYAQHKVNKWIEHKSFLNVTIG